VIAHLVLRLNVADWKQAGGLGLWLWVGFPVVLLTGSISVIFANSGRLDTLESEAGQGFARKAQDSAEKHLKDNARGQT